MTIPLRSYEERAEDVLWIRVAKIKIWEYRVDLHVLVSSLRRHWQQQIRRTYASKTVTVIPCTEYESCLPDSVVSGNLLVNCESMSRIRCCTTRWILGKQKFRIFTREYHPFPTRISSSFWNFLQRIYIRYLPMLMAMNQKLSFDQGLIFTVSRQTQSHTNILSNLKESLYELRWLWVLVIKNSYWLVPTKA